jgi:hypothetical protein
MLGFLKGIGRAIVHGFTGALDVLGEGFWWGIERLLGIPELIGSLLGIRKEKKMRLNVIILRDASNNAVANQADVELVVEEAKVVFMSEANIRIVPLKGASLVEVFPDSTPQWVMNPKCDEGAFKHIFTRVGRWFRQHMRMVVGESGPTIFVVSDVQGKAGCYPGLSDYGYIDGGALPKGGILLSSGMMLTLAHELGHACDLFHRDDARNLMEPTGQLRIANLTRWQSSVARSSRWVKYG